MDESAFLKELLRRTQVLGASSLTTTSLCRGLGPSAPGSGESKPGHPDALPAPPQHPGLRDARI